MYSNDKISPWALTVVFSGPMDPTFILEKCLMDVEKSLDNMKEYPEAKTELKKFTK